jgi:uncharacterized protein YcbX
VFVAELWRYPVKSMGGERLERAELGPEGIPGDRRVIVTDARGRVVTSRRRPKLLPHRAAIVDGEVRVDGRPWNDAEVARDVEAAAGAGSRLVEWDGLERFDVLPLLVATDGAIRSLGDATDVRRFRPNVLVGGVEGLSEREWEGRRLAIGEAIVFAVDLRQRCVMTTFDPDTAAQDTSVLARIQRDLDGSLALNCRVEKPGPVRAGDPVRLL